MSDMTLTYFDFPGGRGEAARLALHVAGADWKDDRLRDGWVDLKPTTPFGGLPILKVHGKGVLSQSNAILGYIGHRFALLPADAWEAAKHVALMNAVEELRAEVATTGKDDKAEKKAAREAFAVGYLARWLANCEAQIEGPFVGGAEMSVADLKLFVALRAYANGVYDDVPTDVLSPFPKIVALMAAVAAQPKVAEWIAK